MGALIGYTLISGLLRHCEPAKVATYAYVNPVVAVILGALFAGETSYLAHDCGSGVNHWIGRDRHHYATIKTEIGAAGFGCIGGSRLIIPERRCSCRCLQRQVAFVLPVTAAATMRQRLAFLACPL